MKTRDRRKALEQKLTRQQRLPWTYVGTVHNMDWAVAVNGVPLPQRQDLYNHSPDGFAWGYNGSGPAQLALAILADCCGDAYALRHYQSFKSAVIAGLPKDQGFTLTNHEVEQWAKETPDAD